MVCVVHVHYNTHVCYSWCQDLSLEQALMHDDSVSGDEPLPLSPPAPQVRSTTPGGNADSMFKVHVQTD